MLQLAFIRQNINEVKERLAVKQFRRTGLIDELIQLDDRRKKLQFEKDEIRGKINKLSEETGSLMREGKKEEAEKKKTEVVSYKSMLSDLSELTELENKMNSILVQIPNIPSVKVPVGNSSEDNVLVRSGGRIPELPTKALPHWDLCKKFDLIDFELGNKITGSGFPLYKNKGAKLQRALIEYFLDYNTAAGYTEYRPPLMVNESSAYGTGQLPDKEGQMYFIQEDKFYLIPTSEVPLTNIYRDEMVKEKDLPLKMTAYTPCFRREAGSYGKDVRGLNRLHQFDKVEIVQLVDPEKSYAVLEDMVNHIEGLLISLELPYRIVNLCGGDLGFTSAMTYDFEAYSAAQDKWLEVSSVSNFETYQTNRMKIRYKEDTGKTKLLHSLNGSSLALPRIMACLLENNQTADGIDLPKPLHNYMESSSIKNP